MMFIVFCVLPLSSGALPVNTKEDLGRDATLGDGLRGNENTEDITGLTSV